MCAEIPKNNGGNQVKPSLRRKIFGCTLLTLFFCLLGLMIYTLYAPIDMDIPRTLLRSYVFIILIGTILAAPIELAMKIDRLKLKLSKIRSLMVIRKTGLLLLTICLFGMITTNLSAWIQLRFAPEHIMYAQITDMHHHRRGCNKWTLLLQTNRSVTVCKTGPNLHWRKGRILKVAVRQTSWAYEVHYLEHITVPSIEP